MRSVRTVAGYRLAKQRGEELSKEQELELAAAEDRLQLLDGLEVLEHVMSITRSGIELGRRPDRVVEVKPMFDNKPPHRKPH